MLQLNTKVKVLDNSGAVKARIIKILNKKKFGKVGGLVLVSIVKNLRGSKIRKGSVQKAIIVRTNTSTRGLHCKTRWFENSIVLVKEKGNDYLPIGSRIKGVLSSELKNKIGCKKITSLCGKTL